MKTIDATPTWSDVLPMLLRAIEKPHSKEAYRIAKEEIERMAKMADAYVESQKTKDF